MGSRVFRNSCLGAEGLGFRVTRMRKPDYLLSTLVMMT